MKTPFSLAFATIAAFFAASASAIELGWTAGPMASDGSTIRTDGTLLYAYSYHGGTVCGVLFTSVTDLANASMVSASPVIAGSVNSDFQTDGASGAFGHMMEGGWYWGGSGSASGELSATLTLTGLTAGNTYLVQLVSHRQSNSTLVSANGSTPVHIHGSDEANYKYGCSIVGVFEATGTTKDVVITYSAQSSGMRPLNAIQVRELPGGGGEEPEPVDPDPMPVYTLTIPDTTGLVLQSVTTNGVAVTAVSGSYSIVSNTQVTVTFTAASGYEIVSGNPVVFTITGAKTFVDADYPVVQATSGGGDPIVPVESGWSGEPMGSTSASIRTDGALKYAYARGNYTVNGVTFVGSDSIISNENCVVWEATGGAQTIPLTAPTDTEEGGYKNLLQTAWWATAKGRKILLNNLESGKKYLVQIIVFRNDGASHTATAPDGVQTIHFGGTDWEYGGSLIGIFTASGPSEEFTIQYTGTACINGIQVRELSSAGPVSSRGLFFICK